MQLIIDKIIRKPEEPEGVVATLIERMYGITQPFTYEILRKSLDARDKLHIVYLYRVLITVPDKLGETLLGKPGVQPYQISNAAPTGPFSAPVQPVIIVGAGPAGLFCALRIIEHGGRVVLLEQGAPVEERLMHIASLKSAGRLNTQSNVLFGEGGAGTYSDGKLTTRINRPEVAWFFQQMVKWGAPKTILHEQKPHVGTDRLVPILQAIRRHIEASDSRMLFHAQVVDIIQSDGTITGVVTRKGDEYHGKRVVLACGHSARETYSLLSARGVALEKKGFAVGLRAEHPAALINGIQYGAMAKRNILPTADYRLTFNNRQTGRGVYSFCMCPGGEVINSSSEAGHLCVNGMSYSGRDQAWSNAAIVVSVHPEDVPGHVLAGIDFQRRLEAAAFEAGGGGFFAPAQRITSFLAGTLDTGLPPASYQPGVRAALHEYLPEWLRQELKLALVYFNRRMKGFISSDALLIGVETRTSSPVRISRGSDMQSPVLAGLYPVGEGAGYAGGIVSSAVDGIRAADIICS